MGDMVERLRQSEHRHNAPITGFAQFADNTDVLTRVQYIRQNYPFPWEGGDHADDPMAPTARSFDEPDDGA